jgi:predicted transcriptional regulator
VESISKLEVVSIILKKSHKSCGLHELYSKLQVHLTMSQLMKYIFELKRYELLISLKPETNYMITPKGIQYLEIHDELKNQICSENANNSAVLNIHIPFFRLTSFSKKISNYFER